MRLREEIENLAIMSESYAYGEILEVNLIKLQTELLLDIRDLLTERKQYELERK